MKMEKIALFLPSLNTYYLSIFSSLKKEFERRGIEVNGWPCLLEEEELVEFCRQFKPDCILEVNRTRNQIPWLPKDIKHISWMFDVGEWKYDSLGGSQIIYFFGANWIKNFQSLGNENIKWLPPAMCGIDYQFGINKKVADFSFVGHIPNPWNRSDLSRNIDTDNQSVTFDDIMTKCQSLWAKIDLKGFDNQEYFNSAMRIVYELTGKNISITDKKIRYDFSCRIIRQMNRKNLINLVLKYSKSLRIYGTTTWENYEKFTEFYIKYLNSPIDLKGVFQSTKINLHEGVGLHDRVFSIMGSGGFLFYRESPDDNDYGGINTVFEPFVHYIPFNEETFGELSDQYLGNVGERDKISIKSSLLVHKEHTWFNRVSKIISDINEL